MICERCHGKGAIRLVFIPQGAGWPPGATESVLLPCPDCGGCGHQHCCEGERPGNVPEEER